MVTALPSVTGSPSWNRRSTGPHPPSGAFPCGGGRGSKKRKAPEQFSPRPRLLHAHPPTRESSAQGWTLTASKKRKYRNRQTPEMKKTRTGGAGLLGFNGGEPVMAREHHHTTRLRLSAGLYVRHSVSSRGRSPGAR